MKVAVQSAVFKGTALERALASGKYRCTPLGFEKCCSACDDYWPADNEFFYRQSSSADGLAGICRACYEDRRGRRRTQ